MMYFLYHKKLFFALRDQSASDAGTEAAGVALRQPRRACSRRGQHASISAAGNIAPPDSARALQATCATIYPFGLAGAQPGVARGTFYRPWEGLSCPAAAGMPARVGPGCCDAGGSGSECGPAPSRSAFLIVEGEHRAASAISALSAVSAVSSATSIADPGSESSPSAGCAAAAAVASMRADPRRVTPSATCAARAAAAGGGGDGFGDNSAGGGEGGCGAGFRSRLAASTRQR